MRALTVTLVCVCVLCGSPLFAQTPGLIVKPESPSRSQLMLLSEFVYDSKKPGMFGKWFNAQASRRTDSRTEKEQLREQWEEFLGIDVFYPYFKARQVEKYVQEKTRVDFFNFKGKAEFETGSSSFRYIFKKKF
jgi:hypothetical protein